MKSKAKTRQGNEEQLRSLSSWDTRLSVIQRPTTIQSPMIATENIPDERSNKLPSDVAVADVDGTFVADGLHQVIVSRLRAKHIDRELTSRSDSMRWALYRSYPTSVRSLFHRSSQNKAVVWRAGTPNSSPPAVRQTVHPPYTSYPMLARL